MSKNNLKQWCEGNNRVELIKEWDKEKNIRVLGLKIDEITKGSGKKVWWLCSESHSYEAIVKNRVNLGSGCPYCNNKKVMKGYNDFSTWCEENGKEHLLEDWDTEKNSKDFNLDITDITYGSGKIVYWKCQDNHYYKQTIKDKSIKGHGCPICCNQRVLEGYNDLAATNPELIEEWDTIKNRELLGLEITTVSRGSDKKVYWKCSKGHSYKQTVSKKTIEGHNCPICSNQKILEGFNDLATTNPEILDEWDYEKNNKSRVKPEEVTAGSDRKVSWVCKTNKNHKWKTSINKRTGGQKTGCPICNIGNQTSFIEQYLYYTLKSKFKEVSNREIIDGFEYDIYIKDIGLLIEYDGYYYHRVLRNGKKREIEKTKKAKEIGYDFIRIKEVNKKIKELKINESNIIGFKYSNKIEDINIIIEVLIKYINNKYNKNITLEIPKNIEQKVRGEILRDKMDNSIQVKYPELTKEWDYEFNKCLEPKHFTMGSQVKVWWLCKEGHRWQASIVNRARKGSGCPYCRN